MKMIYLYFSFSDIFLARTPRALCRKNIPHCVANQIASFLKVGQLVMLIHVMCVLFREGWGDLVHAA